MGVGHRRSQKGTGNISLVELGNLAREPCGIRSGHSMNQNAGFGKSLVEVMLWSLFHLLGSRLVQFSPSFVAECARGYNSYVGMILNPSDVTR